MDLYVTDQSPNCSRTMPSFYRSFLAMFLNVQSMEGEIVHWNVRFYFRKNRPPDETFGVLVSATRDYNDTCDLPSLSMR